MIDNKRKKLFIELFNSILFAVIILMIIFTRSFVGLKIFNFRLGELIVAFGLVLVIFYLFFNTFANKEYFAFFPNKYFLLLIGLFVITVLFTRGSFIEQYTYKSSSFLWMVGYTFLGYFFFRNLKFNKFHFYSLGLTPLVIYVFNSGNYPNFIMNFFQSYGDKFQFIKGSDVLMGFIFCTFILKDQFKNEYHFLYYINLVGALLLPLFLTLSRASFFSSFLLILSVNLSQYKVIKSKGKKYFGLLLITIIFFTLSTIRVAGLPDLNQRSSEPIVVIQDSVVEVVERKQVNKYFGLYICEGRLCSEDNTLDWRLDIWFDLMNDQTKKGKLVLGFGFNEIFEIMKDPNKPGRLGRDGLNENVHNHLFTLFGRMGIIGLLVYVLFQYNLISSLKENVFIYLIPLFLVSSFDTTMESIQFPFLYYFLISYYESRKT